MKRIMLTVSYDGTDYVGWQIQKNGLAVEQVINEHLHRLLGEDIRVIGASRTDSGVHALGNIAVFDTETKIPPEKLCFALNQSLPADIRIARSKEVPLNFHPRKGPCVKTYRYEITNCRYEIPVRRRYSDYIYYPMDIEKMKEAAKCLEGEHDFIGFSSSGGQQRTSVRTIYSIEIEAQPLLCPVPEIKDAAGPAGDYTPQSISMTVEGNGFLYNMVRIIAGTLEKIAVGVYLPDYTKKILNSADRSLQTHKAPAKGLCLMKIDYPGLEER